MISPETYQILMYAMLSLAPLVFCLLFFVSAPYGRFVRRGWGPQIDARFGWILMEMPASLLVVVIMLGQVEMTAVLWVFLSLWQLHYFHRAFIYPFTLRGRRVMPVVVVFMGMAFNTVNAVLIAYYFVFHQEDYSNSWFLSPWFASGLALFLGGYVITKKSDRILRNLREPGESDYKIPQGFIYRYVSSPNYLGEIIQWAGWTILTCSMAGFVFLVWTIANLLPRALSHHHWYQQEFENYPPERKAILPFIL